MMLSDYLIVFSEDCDRLNRMFGNQLLIGTIILELTYSFNEFFFNN